MGLPKLQKSLLVLMQNIFELQLITNCSLILNFDKSLEIKCICVNMTLPLTMQTYSGKDNPTFQAFSLLMITNYLVIRVDFPFSNIHNMFQITC